ncbi:efflux RND transporter permease subunit [Cerasicoccus fimbriatus]|uniref:efflux RND transporter permease subunit n=1 Tax=Cerasicoccus fimbriatus TaxID=3014554 RepID=UPI0022B3348E|nr:efflux RND transporter permease subunit [Cerasicoccus sp. TK19100]
MSNDHSSSAKGPIAWMAGHSVTANLIMLVFLIGGALVISNVKQEVFPEFSLDMVNVSVSYPGAAPEEVEQSIVLPVEEAVEGLDGVKEVTSTANEGSGTVTIELAEGADLQQLANEIKNEIDRITTFPEEAEEPNVAIASRQRSVVTLALHGDLDEWTLRSVAETVRDSLLSNPGITQVELEGARDYEVTITVPRESLRLYGLTLNDIASIVSASSLDLAGGGVKTATGEILVRVKERRDYAAEFNNIPVITTNDGVRVLLGDIATITDGFEETSDLYAHFNGEPVVLLEVFRIGNQTPIGVSDAAMEVVEELRATLPPGLTLDIMSDNSEIYRQRAELLVKNLLMGLVLVLIVLGIFLETRLAFWVTLGIPISFLGAFMFFPPLDTTINMITMFAFIITLGIVVDDAIVVGENIYSHHQRGKSFYVAAIDGTREVAMPVVFSVLTNIVAFMPLFFIPGFMGKIFGVIPIVVIGVFSVSLIESLFILPAHLSHQKDIHPKGIRGALHNFQQRFSNKFMGFVHNRYGPALRRVLPWRYVVVVIGLSFMALIFSWVDSGRLHMILMPRVDSDYAFASVELPYGSPVEETEKIRQQVLSAAERVVANNGGDKLSKGIYTLVGSGGSHAVQFRVFLTDANTRPLSTAQFTQQWRQEVGQLFGVDTSSFASDRGGPGSGDSITVELSHRDIATLEAAAERLAHELMEYPQTKDVNDGFQPGKEQFNFTLRPEAQSLGLTSQNVAQQVRGAFYGAEAKRQLRGRHEIKIMARLPKDQRTSEADVDSLIIMTPTGGEMPLAEAVDIDRDRAFTSISRRNGRRVLNVTADTDDPADAGPIMTDLRTNVLPLLAAEYPGLSYGFEGRQADMEESVHAMILGLLLAVCGVYALLAIPFNSYSQPAIVMVAIPFGIVGAVIGHIIMGYNLSLMSLFGIVALSGVVVNDSLVLIDRTNSLRAEGLPPVEAIVQAAISRFRAIILTTLTTFGGLFPMIMETSRQARFMIPMAISLGFGILFTTFIVLLLVPCFYLILEDIKGRKLKATNTITQPPLTNATETL